MENKVRFRIKRGYYLELLTSETVELFGSSKSKIIKDKNGESVLHLKIAEVVLAHCNFFNNNYQQDSRVLYTFIPNISFGQLLETSKNLHKTPKNF